MDWRSFLHLWPRESDADAVARMTSAQWRTVSRRTTTYMENYRDKPGSQDRAQRRAAWIAALPVFAEATSVLEVGCGAGRNLAALKRAHPSLVVSGLDINADALSAARTAVPSGLFSKANLYEMERFPAADVLLTCGVLVHLHPSKLGAIVARLAAAARQACVFVEEVECDGPARVIKGPKQWGAENATADYCLWSVSLEVLVATFECRVTYGNLPAPLRSIGASHVVGVMIHHIGSPVIERDEE